MRTNRRSRTSAGTRRNISTTGRRRSVSLGEPGGAGGNTTFNVFADFWGFEPRLCPAYRAQTKGKVESGVKYFKRNFLVGRLFRDDLDL